MICQKASRNGLVIYDDIFPLEISAFRYFEFDRYLRTSELDTTLYSTDVNFKWAGINRSFWSLVREYEKRNHGITGRIKKYHRFTRLDGRLLYSVFVNNIFKVLGKIEKHRLPFVFTLYPGGGFYLNNEETEQKLEKIFSSPYFHKVIVTQKLVMDYLLKKKYCPSEKIDFIYGGPFLPAGIKKGFEVKKWYYGENKSTFDICFMAHRYVPQGVDKGYDVFIKVCHLLSGMADIRFHVVGGFCAEDLDISRIRDKMEFHGTMVGSDFPRFFRNIDLIISPNRPFIYDKGSFDGFPTASCITAASYGTAILAADELDMNFAFIDQEDIDIITIDPDEIAQKIRRYYTNPEIIYRLAAKGQEKVCRLFDPDFQLGKRVEILKPLLMNYN